MRRTRKRKRARVRAHKPSRVVTPAERGYDTYDRTDYGYSLHGFDELGRLPAGFAIEFDPYLLYVNEPS